MSQLKSSLILVVPLLLASIACAAVQQQDTTGDVVVATLTPDPNAATPTIDPVLLAATPYPLENVIAVLDRQQITLSQPNLPGIYPSGNYYQSLYVELIESQNVQNRDVTYITVTIFPDDDTAKAYFQGLKAGVPTGLIVDGDNEVQLEVTENAFDRVDLSYLSRWFRSAQPTGTSPGIQESYYVVHACNFVYSYEVIDFFGENLGSPVPEQTEVTGRVVQTGQGLSAMICPEESISWR